MQEAPGRKKKQKSKATRLKNGGHAQTATKNAKNEWKLIITIIRRRTVQCWTAEDEPCSGLFVWLLERKACHARDVGTQSCTQRRSRDDYNQYLLKRSPRSVSHTLGRTRPQFGPPYARRDTDIKFVDKRSAPLVVSAALGAVRDCLSVVAGSL